MSDPLIKALENERRYVARELHDNVAQTTLQLGLQAGICNKLLERDNLEMLTTELAELEKRIQLASSQVRELIADLRPPQLEPESELNDYIETAIEVHLERAGPPIEYQLEVSDRGASLSPEQKLTVFRIVQEALLNVRKHAEAKKVHLTLSDDDSNYIATITDDGQGFDPAEIDQRPVDKGGAGLTNLRTRAEQLGGSVTFTSSPDRGGSELALTFPK